MENSYNSLHIEAKKHMLDGLDKLTKVSENLLNLGYRNDGYFRFVKDIKEVNGRPIDLRNGESLSFDIRLYVQTPGWFSTSFYSNYKYKESTDSDKRERFLKNAASKDMVEYLEKECTKEII